MIETKKQATRALQQIQKITGWSQREIAKRSGVNHATISRILAKATTNVLPTESVRTSIYELLLVAKAIPVNAE